jgi:hypothetical protein
MESLKKCHKVFFERNDKRFVVFFIRRRALRTHSNKKTESRWWEQQLPALASKPLEPQLRTTVGKEKNKNMKKTYTWKQLS